MTHFTYRDRWPEDGPDDRRYYRAAECLTCGTIFGTEAEDGPVPERCPDCLRRFHRERRAAQRARRAGKPEPAVTRPEPEPVSDGAWILRPGVDMEPRELVGEGEHLQPVDHRRLRRTRYGVEYGIGDKVANRPRVIGTDDRPAALDVDHERRELTVLADRLRRACERLRRTDEERRHLIFLDEREDVLRDVLRQEDALPPPLVIDGTPIPEHLRRLVERRMIRDAMT